MENPTHLGDGVYAHFDGSGVSISVNDHNAAPVVYLETRVIVNLNNWLAALKLEESKP